MYYLLSLPHKEQAKTRLKKIIQLVFVVQVKLIKLKKIVTWLHLVVLVGNFCIICNVKMKVTLYLLK